MTADRRIPHVPDAEQAVLGAMMLAPRTAVDVRQIIAGGDFYQLAHELVFDAVCHLDDVQQPCDPIAVAAHLDQAGHLDQVGGRAYLADLVAACPIAADAPYWAGLIREAADGRRIIDLAQKALQVGFDTSIPATDRLEQIRSSFDAAARTRVDGVRRFADTLDAVIDRLDQGVQPGIPTPWPDLTSLIYGWQPGKLYVVGARPGIGKSLLLQGAARHLDQQGLATYYASLEMGAEELTRRALADQAAVRLSAISRSTLDESEWGRIAPADAALRTSLIHIADGEQSMAQIRAGARTLARRHKLGMIAIDYLQLLQPRDRRAPREQQVAEMSREAKLMAQALDVPVIMLAQLNRGPEQRADRKPTLSDLRESGAIEQDADVVLLLNPADTDPKYTLDVFVAKHRDGPTGELSLLKQGVFARLRSLERRNPS